MLGVSQGTLRTYEDRDVFLAIGRVDEDLTIYSRLKSNRSLTLDEVTSRWVEELLGQVETEEDMANFKNFRIMIRGAIFDAKEKRKFIRTISIVDSVAVVGEGDADSRLQPEPVIYRFSKPQNLGNARATLVPSTQLASIFE